jgi:UDP-N-acetylmuramate dehydrogenase
LSGVPGSVGATPIQNVGAYGREISEVLRSVTVYDREQDRQLTLTPEQCGFTYRNSVFKHSQRYVVLDVTLALRRDATASPLRYGELSRRLGAEGDQRVPLTEVRDAVLELRRAKGMVIDATDPDTRSVGSFFTNPILTRERWGALAADLADEPPHWELPDGTVKVAAAWLIEHAGFAKGYRRGGVGISSKHTLALVNHDGTTAELLGLAREITDGVYGRYGVALTPEPVMVGPGLAGGQ